MPPSKLHLHKNKESNQKILHNNSTDNPVIYNHHNDNIDSIRITPKTTQLYYPLKHCKIINTNNDNDDLLHITNLKQQPQQQHDKINGHIKSPLQVPVTKLPKPHTYKQIKLIDDKFQLDIINMIAYVETYYCSITHFTPREMCFTIPYDKVIRLKSNLNFLLFSFSISFLIREEKSNSNISTIKDSNTTIKQFESNVSLQSYKDTSPNLSSSSMKQDLQYLKPSILNGQYSSQVQLNNNHISSHNLLDKNITRRYLNDTKSASISDLSHSSLRINHKTLNNKSIKDSPLLSKSSIFITTESNSLNDVSFTSDNVNNSIHQHPKITIIREDVNNRKMNSYPKLPITQQLTYRKDIPLDQSPLSNVSYESLPNVSSTSSKLHSSIVQMNNQHHHSNSALHNEMDITNSDKVMHFTNTSYVNSNKINSIRQYEQYKSTPNINIPMKKTKPLKLLSKVNETYVTHIARPLKPEFSNDNLKHFNSSSEQDLLFNSKMKSNTNETNRRFSSELDTLKQYQNKGLLNSYDHYLNKQMNIKKLNETVNNVQLSTCRHRSYEQNLNKNGDVNLSNGHLVQPIVVQRQYASNNFVSSKPLNTQLSENYTNHSDYNPIKNVSFINL
ncbi:Asparagine-rich protein (ARP) [Schistosoma japonicum]|nr:Asparagine-rich protein (ARP) [Schistosoma japonicum]